MRLRIFLWLIVVLSYYSFVLTYTCYDQDYQHPHVCSCPLCGKCVGSDNCTCFAGHWGDQCQFTTCFGVPNTNSSVCNGHGYCGSLDICDCTDGWTGEQCTLKLGVQTIAGDGTNGGDNGLPHLSRFSSPRKIVVDKNETLIVTDTGPTSRRIRGMDFKNERVFTVAGTGNVGSANGDVTVATFNTPLGLSFDVSGNLFVADTQNNRIRKIDFETGLVTTITGSTFSLLDGALASARFRNPNGLTVNGTNVYVADTNNHRVRKVDLQSGVVSTFSGSSQGNSDGHRISNARFNGLYDITSNSRGDLFVVDALNRRIRMINSENDQVYTICGNGIQGKVDGPAPLSQTIQPLSIALDRFDENILYFGDQNMLRKINLNTNIVTSIAGTVESGFLDFVDSNSAKFSQIRGVAQLNNGDIIVSDTGNRRIRKISPMRCFGILHYNETVCSGNGLCKGPDDCECNDGYGGNECEKIACFSFTPEHPHVCSCPLCGKCVGSNNCTCFAGHWGNQCQFTTCFGVPNTNSSVCNGHGYCGSLDICDCTDGWTGEQCTIRLEVRTLAGTGEIGYLDSDLLSSEFTSLRGLLIDENDNIIVCDSGNHRLRNVSIPLNIVTTLIGTGAFGHVDGDFASATFGMPTFSAFDKQKNILVLQAASHRIRKLDMELRLVSTISGGIPGVEDGRLSEARFMQLSAIISVESGEFFAVDTDGHRIRLVNSSDDKVSTFAGSGSGFSDGDLTKKARFQNPSDILQNDRLDLFISDRNNYRLRMIPAGSSNIYTLAGTAEKSIVDGHVSVARLSNPMSMIFDRNNDTTIYFAEYDRGMIRRINLLTNIVTTVAGFSVLIMGQPSNGFVDNVVASSAEFRLPSGIAQLNNGDLVVSDTGNGRIRIIKEISCFGLHHTNKSICSERGKCVGSDECECNDGYGGNECEKIACFSFTPEHPHVCSCPLCGKCVGSNNCTCFAGHWGDQCQFTTCFGVPNTNSSVCNGHGYCGSLDICDCTDGWTGEQCTIRLEVRTLAGHDMEFNFISQPPSDGDLLSAEIPEPNGLLVDDYDNIIVTDLGIRNVSMSLNQVTTVVSFGFSMGFGFGFGFGFGGGSPTTADGPFSSAQFMRPGGIFYDHEGNVIVADSSSRIRKLDLTSETVYTIAGGQQIGYADSNLLASRFSTPNDICAIDEHNLIVADKYNNRIRQISISENEVTTISGSMFGFSDSDTSRSLFASPWSVLCMKNETIIVSDNQNNRIRIIRTGTSQVFTLAGTGIQQTLNGHASSSGIQSPRMLSFDRFNNNIIYISEGSGNIRRINSLTNMVTTIAGNSTTGFADNIPASSALFDNPSAITQLSNGKIVVADTGNSRLRIIQVMSCFGIDYFEEAVCSGHGMCIRPDVCECNEGFLGNQCQYMGCFGFPSHHPHVCSCPLCGKCVGSNNCTCFAGHWGNQCQFTTCFGVPNTNSSVCNGHGYCGSLDICDCTDGWTGEQCTIRLEVRTITGKGSGKWGSIQELESAYFENPGSLLVDGNDNLIVCDVGNRIIRNVSIQNNFVNLMAGGGSAGSIDGPFLSSSFSQMMGGISFDGDGNILVGDQFKVRKLELSEKEVTTISGGISGILDGDLSTARFENAIGAYFRSSERIYIPDKNDVLCVIRVVNLINNQVFTFAGNSRSYLDMVPKEKAKFDSISSLAFDEDENIYVADNGNNRVRLIRSSDSIVFTILGNGTSFSTNGHASVSSISSPSATIIDRFNQSILYVVEKGRSNIRKINLLTNMVTTVAGNSTPGFVDVVYASAAQFSEPEGIAQFSNGSLVVSDAGNNRIRIIQPMTCFGIEHYRESVCSRHGECINSDKCECHLGYIGEECQNVYCFDELDNSTDVCSGNGKCVAPDNCACNLNYTGIECSIPKCFGLSESGACNFGNGTCVDVDKCQCNTEYFGDECEITKCYGKWSNDTIACSFPNGTCEKLDTCTCSSGYDGLECQNALCFGKSSSDVSQVCNFGNGTCISPDICSCVEGYKGNECEIPLCHGIWADDQQSCGNGSCTKFGTCQCNEGYYGQECEFYDCFGYKFDTNLACNFNNGTCVSPNSCRCNIGYFGDICDVSLCFGHFSNDSQVCGGNGKCISPGICVCIEGWIGNDCQIPLCFAIEATDPTVCSNGSGVCVAPDICNCSLGFTGISCDIPICFEIAANNDSVCSSHGMCRFPNQCECNSTEYVGNMCEIPMCHGVNGSDRIACSGNGICSRFNYCECHVGYSGGNCELTKCFAMWNYDNNSCSNHGECVAYNQCLCDSGWGGIECDIVMCFDHEMNSSEACNGFPCVGPNVCSCPSNYGGSECEKCSPNMSGPNCSIPLCNATILCNSRGICNEDNISCTCMENFAGSFCEFCAPNWFGSGCDYYCHPKLNCSSNGFCTPLGKCECFNDTFNGFWRGDHCSMCQENVLRSSPGKCDVRVKNFKFNNGGDRIYGHLDYIPNPFGYTIPCDWIFLPQTFITLGDNPHCWWPKDTTSFEVILGSNATVMDYDTLLIDRTFTWNPPNKSRFFIKVTVYPAENPRKPVAVIRNLPESIGFCTPIVLDARNSFSLDRRALEMNWKLLGVEGNNSLSLWLSGQKEALITLPSTAVQVGITYSVSLVVTNFRGISSNVVTVRFTRLSSRLPEIQIRGPSLQHVLRSWPVYRLQATVFSSFLCEIEDFTRYSYVWSQSDGKMEVQKIQNGLDLELRSFPSSNEPYINEFMFTVQSKEDMTIKSSVLVSLKVLIRDLVPIIQSNHGTSWNVGHNLVLDGTRSFDPELFDEIESKFTWICINLTMGNESICSFTQNNGDIFLSQSYGPIVNLPAFSAYSGEILKFALSFNKGARNMTTSIIIETVDYEKKLQVTLDPLPPISNRQIENRLIVSSNTSYSPEVDPSSLKYEWRISNNMGSEIPLSKIARSPLDSSQVILDSNQLVAGFDYHITVIVTGHIYKEIGNISLSSNFSSVIKVPLGPLEGFFDVLPPSGTALETEFSLHCTSFMTEYEPLSYSFSYEKVNRMQIDHMSQLIPIVTASANNFARVTLPSGNAEDGYLIKIIAIVMDRYGGTVRSERTVKVEPLGQTVFSFSLPELLGKYIHGISDTSRSVSFDIRGSTQTEVDIQKSLVISELLNEQIHDIRSKAEITTTSTSFHTNCNTLEPYCQNNCSNNGKCVKDFCICHQNYGGKDCSLTVSEVEERKLVRSSLVVNVFSSMTKQLQNNAHSKEPIEQLAILAEKLTASSHELTSQALLIIVDFIATLVNQSTVNDRISIYISQSLSNLLSDKIILSNADSGLIFSIESTLDMLLYKIGVEKPVGESATLIRSSSISAAVQRDVSTSFNNRYITLCTPDGSEVGLKLPHNFNSQLGGNVILNYAVLKTDPENNETSIFKDQDIPEAELFDQERTLILEGSEFNIEGGGYIAKVKFFDSEKRYIPLRDLAEPISIKIPIAKDMENSILYSQNTSIICKYWNETTNSWRTEGCSMGLFSEGVVTCLCNHTTEFSAFISTETFNQRRVRLLPRELPLFYIPMSIAVMITLSYIVLLITSLFSKIAKKKCTSEIVPVIKESKLKSKKEISPHPTIHKKTIFFSCLPIYPTCSWIYMLQSVQLALITNCDFKYNWNMWIIQSYGISYLSLSFTLLFGRIFTSFGSFKSMGFQKRLLEFFTRRMQPEKLKKVSPNDMKNSKETRNSDSKSKGKKFTSILRDIENLPTASKVMIIISILAFLSTLFSILTVFAILSLNYIIEEIPTFSLIIIATTYLLYFIICVAHTSLQAQAIHKSKKQSIRMVILKCGAIFILALLILIISLSAPLTLSLLSNELFLQTIFFSTQSCVVAVGLVLIFWIASSMIIKHLPKQSAKLILCMKSRKLKKRKSQKIYNLLQKLCHIAFQILVPILVAGIAMWHTVQGSFRVKFADHAIHFAIIFTISNAFSLIFYPIFKFSLHLWIRMQRKIIFLIFKRNNKKGTHSNYKPQIFK